MLRRTALLAALFTALFMPWPQQAQARSVVTWSYALEDVYSTAVRFVRIDRGCTITERDAQSAFLLFECKDGKQAKHGALELIKTADGVRAQLTLSDDPSYLELRFLELLARKLVDERGPPPPPHAPPAPRNPDGGSN